MTTQQGDTPTWSEHWIENHDAEALEKARDGYWDPDHCLACQMAHSAASKGAVWVYPHLDRAGRRFNLGGWAAFDDVTPWGCNFDSPLDAEWWLMRPDPSDAC